MFNLGSKPASTFTLTSTTTAPPTVGFSYGGGGDKTESSKSTLFGASPNFSFPKSSAATSTSLPFVNSTTTANAFGFAGTIPSSTTNTSSAQQFALGGSSVTTSLSLTPIVSSSASTTGFQLGGGASTSTTGLQLGRTVPSYSMGVCDSTYVAAGRFCQQLFEVEPTYGEAVKSSMNLKESDRQFSDHELARGVECTSTVFEDINKPGHAESMEVIDQPGLLESQSNIEINKSQTCLVTEPCDQDNFTDIINQLEAEFCRVTNVLRKDRIELHRNLIKKFTSNLSKLRTSSSIISFMHHKKLSRSRKIRVQPAAISRRQQEGLPTSGRIQSGRHTTTKMSHNISSTIEDNFSSVE